MQDYAIDYIRLISDAQASDIESVIGFLLEELPYEWRDKYLEMTPHITNICRFYFNDFEYIYDDCSQLEATGVVPYSPTIESRVVGVLGRSRPISEPRDASRLKGWVGPTEKCLGENTDKGHFIAHTIGGGLDVNIFAQRRDINQGRSERGKVYRTMEKYCYLHPGTFCFSRPIYSDLSSRPCMIEFGVLTDFRTLWVERFENQTNKIYGT
jgi:hypothetical protein